jgi:hypothetical protein
MIFNLGVSRAMYRARFLLNVMSFSLSLCWLYAYRADHLIELRARSLIPRAAET